MRHLKIKPKRLSLAILASLVLSASPSVAALEADAGTSRTVTLAVATKKQAAKKQAAKKQAKTAEHGKPRSRQKPHSARHQKTSPAQHATWHAPQGNQSKSAKGLEALHSPKTPKKPRRSRTAPLVIKAKQKSVAAIPEQVAPRTDAVAAPPEILAPPQPQQFRKAETNKSLAAKPLSRRPKSAIVDADTDPDLIVVDDPTSPSYSLMLLALLMAAGACYMYLTRRQQTLVNRRQPERQSSSPKSSSTSRRRRQSDDTTKPDDAEDSAPSPSASEAAEENLNSAPFDDSGITPPTSSSTFDDTAQLPVAPPNCNFELFVEIQLALSAWIDQGADPLANLQNLFSMSEADWLLASAYWGPKYLADDELVRKFNALSTEFRIKYRGSAA